MVSVVIPTHNRAADLYSCITSLLDQIGDDDELIVIDNCSTDRTQEILGLIKLKVRHLKVICDCSNNLARLFNLGWRASKCSYVSFLNDDTVPDAFWLSDTKLWFRELSDASIIGGPTKDMIPRRMRQNSLWMKVALRLYDVLIMEGRFHDVGILTDYGAYSIGDAFPNHPIEVDCLTITNMSVKKQTLEILGGFDESYQYANIDGDFFLRARKANMKLYAVPTASVNHFPNPTGATRSAFFLARDSAIFFARLKPHNFKSFFRLQLNIASFFLFWFLRSWTEGFHVFLQTLAGYRSGLQVVKELDEQP